MQKLVALMSSLLRPEVQADHRMAPLLRFVRWHLGVRLTGYPALVPFANGSRLIVRKGMHGATGNIYHGLFEYSDMAFVLHFLRKGDFFGDIGANVGVYTVLSSAAIGARTRSIEPVSTTADAFLDNVAINHITDLVDLRRVGVGAEPGVLKFSSGLDAMNHVLADDLADEAGIEVPIETLDMLFADATPVMLKIDVEGFELPVLQGGLRLLEDPTLQAILIEINGSGKRYGFDDESIHGELLNFGFCPYRYDPMKRALSKLEGHGDKNTLYLRNVAAVQGRVRQAAPFTILNHSI